MRCTDAHRNADPPQNVSNACVQTPVSRSTTTVSLPPARSPFLKRVGKGVFGSIASETLFEPSNSDPAVVDVIFVQSVDDLVMMSRCRAQTIGGDLC